MTLLSDEKTILSSNGNSIVLTNMRLHSTEKTWGQYYSNTLFLEDISSVEIRYKSNLAFIAIGALFILGFFYQSTMSYSGSGGATFLFIISIVFFLLYWFTRRFVVSITPNGGKAINVMMGNIKTDFLNDFVHKLQSAKQQRRNELYKLQSATYQVN